MLAAAVQIRDPSASSPVARRRPKIPERAQPGTGSLTTLWLWQTSRIPATVKCAGLGKGRRTGPIRDDGAVLTGICGCMYNRSHCSRTSVVQSLTLLTGGTPSVVQSLTHGRRIVRALHGQAGAWPVADGALLSLPRGREIRDPPPRATPLAWPAGGSGASGPAPGEPDPQRRGLVSIREDPTPVTAGREHSAIHSFTIVLY
jgi:hypothetical protein